MVRINYITNVRIPTSRAQGFAIMKMCSEFSNAGCDVSLYVPARSNNENNRDPFEFYNLKKNFEIKNVSNPDLLTITTLNINKMFGPILYWIDVISFYLIVTFKISLDKCDFLYTRDYLAPIFFRNKKNTILEIHDLPRNKWIFKIALRYVRRVFVLNKYLKQEVINMGFNNDDIIIEPSGVDVEEFDIDMSKTQARSALKLPLDKKIIVYSGQFYAWKGVDVLARAALQDSSNSYLFIGGKDQELLDFVNKYSSAPNITVVPFLERSKIPLYLKSADVLALPNSGKETISAKYTSPLKLYEYLASNRPVVAADLPSIHEAVSEDYVFFAKPDDPESFVKVINEVVNDDLNASKKVKAAFDFVTTLTWDKRVRRILNNITNV